MDSQILRELIRITTGYYPLPTETLEETLEKLKKFPTSSLVAIRWWEK